MSRILTGLTLGVQRRHTEKTELRVEMLAHAKCWQEPQNLDGERKGLWPCRFFSVVLLVSRLWRMRLCCSKAPTFQ